MTNTSLTAYLQEAGFWALGIDHDEKEKAHHSILSHLDYDGKGKLLEIGCGFRALAIRATLTWPEMSVTGIDYWVAVYQYSKLCEKTPPARVWPVNMSSSMATPISWIFRTGALML